MLLMLGLRMHIPMLIRVQHGRPIPQKNSHILLKNGLFEALFPKKGHLYANFLFYILTIYPKCLLF